LVCSTHEASATPPIPQVGAILIGGRGGQPLPNLINGLRCQTAPFGVIDVQEMFRDCQTLDRANRLTICLSNAFNRVKHHLSWVVAAFGFS
jgi:hypothetical protein